MGLPRANPKAKALPTCAVCAEPAPHGFWGQHLCDACNERWATTAPMMEALELAHAEAHPEDVERSGVHQFVDQKRWVILKPGVSAKAARAAATAWVLERRRRAA